jgi:hypothetical protein
MNDFGELRENIDSLIRETRLWIRKKSIVESMKRIEEANEKLTELRQRSFGEIQARVVLNRMSDLESLANSVDGILSIREAGKKEDGNIALKCNWNDKHYKAPCSSQAYDFNLLQGRAWCSSPLSKCRDFADEVSLDHHPCYESIALKEMYFGAGWDHSGEITKPRQTKSVRCGRVAILTTRPPDADEIDRLIVGCVFIKRIADDPREETKIYGDMTKSIEIDYDEIKVKFWDYYKNAGNENLILWASGLFRYISDETVLNVLKGIGEKYKSSGRDVAKINELIRYYEKSG